MAKGPEKIFAWGWTVLALCGGLFALSLPDQAVTGVTLILSAIIACPPSAVIIEKQMGARLSGGLRLALVVVFAGVAGLSFAQNGRRFFRASLPPAPPPPKTLLEADANGNTKTRAFTTQGPDWTLNWSFDCAVLGDSGIFNVKVMRQDGKESGNAPVDKIDAADSGAEHYKQGGTFYLDVISECPWHIRVDG